MELFSSSVLVVRLLSYLKNPRKSISNWRDQRALGRIEKNVFYEKNACWANDPGGTKNGPYCSNCWDAHKYKIHLHETVSRGRYQCPSCKVIVQIERYPEEHQDNSIDDYLRWP